MSTVSLITQTIQFSGHPRVIFADARSSLKSSVSYSVCFKAVPLGVFDLYPV